MRLFKDKKGVEITFNAVIIAVLVLIVLVVVIIILTGAFGDIVPGLDRFMSCDGRDGHCSISKEDGHTCIYKYHECGKDNREEYCCFPKG